jgi:hypothetical protein
MSIGRDHPHPPAIDDSRLDSAEVLAAIADGTLTFDRISDETLDRCIRTYGVEALAWALLNAAVRSIRNEG